MNIPRTVWLALGAALLALHSAALAAEWRPLFNGRDLSGWRHWVGRPHESNTLEGAKRDEAGKYVDFVGWDKNTFDIFTVVEAEGERVIRISGQVFGVLITEESFRDYHLRLQFRWGEKKWAPRLTAVRDSGLLFHVYRDPGFEGRTWPRSVELQIQEHDCGDLYPINSRITVRARTETGPDGKPRYIYDPTGEALQFEQPGDRSRCIKFPDAEKPNGEWNTIELIVLGDDAIYVVNGKVVMRLNDALQQDDAKQWRRLDSGRIALQSEGAEVFYRKIELRPITSAPSEYADR